MKKFLLPAVLLLLACLNAAAQGDDKSPELTAHLGLSGSPIMASTYFSPSSQSSDSYGSLSNIYADKSGPAYTFGTIIAGLDIRLSRVVAVSVDLGVNSIWADTFSGVTSEKTGTSTSVSVHLVPKVKLYYMDRPMVRLYGSVGFGMGRYFGSTKKSYNFSNPFTFECQCNPFGIEVGRKFFGFAEFGVGTVYCGMQAGVGYKF